jgi:hypothetical protein
MDLVSDYDAYLVGEDRAAQLRREADAYRLTRALAQMHADRFPTVRRLGAGLSGRLSGRVSARRSGLARSGRTAASRAVPTSGSVEPCPC